MTTLQPGQQLGPYQIISPIGKGGMAIVYKAYHAAVDRYVAIKIISNQLLENAEFLKRFQQEARVIAKLEHPHILPIHDFGQIDGIPYMVMRYLEAGTLKEHLRNGPLALPEVDRIFTQLTDALQYAHENGVIHRDIKPSNAMLDKRGDIFLTDFGVAKILEGTSGLTATGTITGTPDYMSPEQAQGLKIDARSDVYSLGILLFEMLTGHVPFEAETPLAVLFKQIQEPPPPLSIVRPDLPYQLEPVLLKALTKNPNDRFASIADFHSAWKLAYAGFSTTRDLPTGPTSAPTPPQPAPTQQAAVINAPTTAAAVTPAGPTQAVTVQAVPETKPVAPQVKPRRKGFWLIISTGLALLAVVAVVLAGFPTLLRARSAASAQKTNAAEQAVTPVQTATPAPTKVKVATGNQNVTSWAGGNSVYSILPMQGLIYTAGQGGITQWNPSDGSYVQWTMRDGLPSAYVPVLYQTPDSAIWICTTAGLVRLTSDARELYTSQLGLDSDYITALTWHKSKLWVGTQYCGYDGCGLQTLVDRKWEVVKDFPSKLEPDQTHVGYNIHFLLPDSKGRIWVATDAGLTMLDGQGRWRVFKTTNGLPNDLVYSILEDDKGQIWVGTEDGGVARYNAVTLKFEPQFDLRREGIYSVTAMLQTGDGHYWFAGYGLTEYDPKANGFTRHSIYNNNFPAEYPVSMAQGMDGALYFGTANEGLVQYKNGEYKLWAVSNAPRFAGYIQIVPDKDGSLYFVEQYWNGVDRFDPNKGEWLYPKDEEVSIPRAMDASGNLWSGAYDGIWKLSPARSRLNLTTKNGLPSDNINDIAFDKSGNTWVATDKGLVAIKGETIISIIPGPELGMVNEVVRKVFVDSAGGIWVSGNEGDTVGHLPPGGKWTWYSAYLVFGANVDYITDFAEDKNGDVLVSTYGDGLYRHTPRGEWSRIHLGDPGINFPISNILCVTVAPNGDIWLGLKDRAVRFDGKIWQGFSIKEGLSGLAVYDIYFGPDGAAWFATDGGITRFAP